MSFYEEPKDMIKQHKRETAAARKEKVIFATRVDGSPLFLKYISVLDNAIVLVNEEIEFLTQQVGEVKKKKILVLDLSQNCLRILPRQISQLQTLTRLNLSRNLLRFLPPEINLLQNLNYLNVSYNTIKCLPESLCDLREMKELLLNQNQITELPREIWRLKNLQTLNISNNRLRYLPGSFCRLKYLRTVQISSNHLQSTTAVEDCSAEQNSPPSLLETVARWFYRRGYYDSQLIPGDVRGFLGKSKVCPSCKGPFFQYCVKRIRMWSFRGQKIPLLYELCSPHWDNEDERIRDLFSINGYTAPSKDVIVYQEEVQSPLSKLKRSHSNSLSRSRTSLSNSLEFVCSPSSPKKSLTSKARIKRTFRRSKSEHPSSSLLLPDTVITFQHNRSLEAINPDDL